MDLLVNQTFSRLEIKMPFVRVTLKKGKPLEFKKNISSSIHQALMDAYAIPEDDLFQVIEEIDGENIIYPASYMGIKHSSDIIYIAITAKIGRTVEMKKSLYEKIVDNIHASNQHNKNDVVITLMENSEANWSFGNGEAQLVT